MTPESSYGRLAEVRDVLGRHFETHAPSLAAALQAWRELSGFGAARKPDPDTWRAMARGCDEWLDEALEIL